MLKKYNNYKNSDSEYVGKVPIEWNKFRLKVLFDREVNGYWGNELKDGEKGITVIRVADFNYENLSIKLSKLTYRAVDQSKINDRKLKKGDLIIEKSGGGEKTPVGRIVVFTDDLDAITSNFLAKLSPKRDLGYYMFLAYLFSDLYSKKVVTKHIKQTTGIQNLDFEAYSNEYVYLPELNDQVKIANFLVYKTSLIDSLIQKNEKIIKLLEGKKTTIINNFVSQIAQVYKTKLKYYLSKIGSGVTPKGGSTVYKLEGIPLIRSQNILNNKLELKNVAYIDAEIHQSMSNSQVKKGDVLFNITGASIGRCYYYNLENEANVNQHVCILRPNKKLLTKFLHVLLISHNGQQQVEKNNTGSGRQGLNFESLKNFEFFIPDLVTQTKIVSELENVVETIDGSVNSKKKQISLLKEYKKTLISSVVTGKIDVRDEKIPESGIKYTYA